MLYSRAQELSLLALWTIDIDDGRTSSDSEQDYGSFFAGRIPLTVNNASRYMHKVTGTGLDVLCTARPELHQNSSLGDVKEGVVFTVVVPPRRASRGSSD